MDWKFCWHLCLGLFTFMSWSSRTLAQNSSTWTFNIPKKSFLSFSPDLQNDQSQHLSLSFRTHRFNCLLFCHFVDRYDTKELPYLRNYQLSAEIQQGMLHITYNLNEYTDVIELGRGELSITFNLHKCSSVYIQQITGCPSFPKLFRK